MGDLILLLATIAVAMINMVLSFLAGLHKSEDGSGLDLMLTEMNPLKHLELLRPSKYLPRGRRYLYAAWVRSFS